MNPEEMLTNKINNNLSKNYDWKKTTKSRLRNSTKKQVYRQNFTSGNYYDVLNFISDEDEVNVQKENKPEKQINYVKERGQTINQKVKSWCN